MFHPTPPHLLYFYANLDELRDPYFQKVGKYVPSDLPWLRQCSHYHHWRRHKGWGWGGAACLSPGCKPLLPGCAPAGKPSSFRLVMQHQFFAFHTNWSIATEENYIRLTQCTSRQSMSFAFRLNSSCAHHLVTVPTFAVTIYHFLGLSLSDLKLICFTYPFFLIPTGLPSWILNLYRTKWALTRACFSFCFLLFSFVSGYVC